MIRPRRSPRYSATAGTTGSDTDALQTDVMRFMSILGLCLMAVFALVQSLPLHETDSLRLEPEREQLHRAIADQQQQAQVLATELQRLHQQIEQAQLSKTLVQEELSATQQQLAQLADQTENARNAQRHLNIELDSLRQQLSQGRYALAALQQAADDKAQSLQTLEQRLDQERKRLDGIRQRSREVKIQQARVTRPPVPEKRPPVKRKGFTLRFASDVALRRQVAAGTVSLYAMADKQAWRLSLPQGRPVFSGAAFPGWFHEMATSTVPPEYIRNLQTTIGRTAASSVVWGVQLPLTTKRGIASLTRDRQGGDLVIAADGRVTLAAE